MNHEKTNYRKRQLQSKIKQIQLLQGRLSRALGNRPKPLQTEIN